MQMIAEIYFRGRLKELVSKYIDVLVAASGCPDTRTQAALSFAIIITPLITWLDISLHW